MSSSSSSSPVLSPKRKTARSIYLSELKEEYSGASNRRFAELGNDVILTSAIINQVTEAWNQGGRYISSEKNRRLVFRFTDDSDQEREYIVDAKWMSTLPMVMTRAIKKMVDVHAISRKRRGQNGDMVLGRKVPHYVNSEVLKPLAEAIGLDLEYLSTGNMATRFSVSMLITSYISFARLHNKINGQIIDVDDNLRNVLYSKAYAFYNSRGVKVLGMDDSSPTLFDIIDTRSRASRPYRQFMVILETLHKFRDRAGHGVDDAEFASSKAQAQDAIGATEEETADNLRQMYDHYNTQLSDRFYTKENADRYKEYRDKAEKTMQSREFSDRHFPFSTVATINSMLVASVKLLEAGMMEAERDKDKKRYSSLSEIVEGLQSKGFIADMLKEETIIDKRHKEIKAESEARKLKSPKRGKKKATKRNTLGSMVKFSKK